jgi:hypothetical protein
MVVTSGLDHPDPWATHVTVALVFEHLAQSFTEDQIEPFLVFLIKDEALGDRSLDVRRGMLRAGTAVIDIHGTERLAVLLSTFEEHLGGPSPANDTGFKSSGISTPRTHAFPVSSTDWLSVLHIH